MTTTQPKADDKRCSKCKEYKAKEEFSVRTASKDGLQEWCKPCTRAANKKSAQKRKNKQQRPTIIEDNSKRTLIPKEIVLKLTPLYEYLTLLQETGGILRMSKTPGEIIDFFGFKPRVGIDLLYKHIKLVPDKGYKWVDKPKSARALARSYLTILKITKVQQKISPELLYQQFLMMREELHEINSSLKQITTSLT